MQQKFKTTLFWRTAIYSIYFSFPGKKSFRKLSKYLIIQWLFHRLTSEQTDIWPEVENSCGRKETGKGKRKRQREMKINIWRRDKKAASTPSSLPVRNSPICLVALCLNFQKYLHRHIYTHSSISLTFSCFVVPTTLCHIHTG